MAGAVRLVPVPVVIATVAVAAVAVTVVMAVPGTAVVIVVVAAAVAVSAYTVVSVVTERSEVRESLRRLEGYQIQRSRDRELLVSFDERVLSPVGNRLVAISRRITPVGYVDNLNKKLEQAGRPKNIDVEQLIAAKAVALVLPILWFAVIFFLFGISGVPAIALWLLLSGVGFILPDVLLSRTVNERKHEIAVTLPDILDLLTISVEAGLGFEQALDRTTAAIPGALSDEFNRMLREMRLGTSRADGLRSLEERTDVPELRSFVLAMLQADTFGVSISRLLRSQAEEMRIRRRQRAQEMAQKAPVKMLFPLVFCIFPSIFVIVLGPAVIQVSDVF